MDLTIKLFNTIIPYCTSVKGPCLISVLFFPMLSCHSSCSDLADLVEMVGVLVRLMEKLQARGTLRV